MIAITNTSAYSSLEYIDNTNLTVIPTQSQIQTMIGSNEFINAVITTAFKNLLIQISNESNQHPSLTGKISQMFNRVGFYIENGSIHFMANEGALDAGTEMIINDLNLYDKNVEFEKIAYDAFHNNTWAKKANDTRAMANSGLQKLHYITVFSYSNADNDFNYPSNISNPKNILNRRAEGSQRFLMINLNQNEDPVMPTVRIKNNSNVIIKLRVKVEHENYVASTYRNGAFTPAGASAGAFGPAIPYDLNNNGSIQTNENIYLNRRFIDYFPNEANSEEIEGDVFTILLDPQEAWNINFDNRIRGGTATIDLIPEPENVPSWPEGNHHYFKFHIRAKNPTYQQVQNYLNTQNYLTRFWFTIRKIRQETGSYGNFNSLSPTNSNYEFKHFDRRSTSQNYNLRKNLRTGLPLFGPPRGFGLGQIDNIGEATSSQVPSPPLPGDTVEMNINESGTMVLRTIDFARKKVATDQEVWHWKRNIDRGIWFIENEKMNITKTKIMSIRTAVINWNNNHPSNLVTIPSPVQYDSIAYAWIPTEIVELTQYNNLFNEGNPPTFTNPNNLVIKSFFDAMLLKSYNGNSGGFFMDITYQSGTNKPILTINQATTNGHFYVREVSNRND